MSTGDLLLNGVFYVVALIGLGGAAGVAFSKNIVRSSFALLGVLFAAAALYAIMKADFMFAAQVLIYVGGILVLIIFAIMLTHKITDVNISNESTPGPVAFFAVGLMLFTLGVLILTYEGWPEQDMSDEGLMKDYKETVDGLADKMKTAAAIARQDAIALGARPEDVKPPEKIKPVTPPDGLTKTLGYGLMSKFLLAFEVISVLLLACLIGAAFLARKEVRPPA